MTQLDRTQIEAILPHRDPFLFVDEVSELVPGERIVGHHHVGDSEKFLNRERKLPPTLLAEVMAQVGAILPLYSDENQGKTIFFRAIDGAKFHRHVEAGETVRVEASVKKMRARFGTFTVSAFVGNTLVASGVMSFALS
jgi:3-hydroxyacyl-[acyl-carrier-protein] dehydratase